MSPFRTIKKFFFPEFNSHYIVRIILVAVIAFIIFRFILAPFYIHGESMAPTYRSHSVTMSWRIPYLFSEPERGDIVIIRLVGERVALLKRIVGLPGETVAFREGDLYINGQRVYEPYVRKPSDWNLAPRVIEKNHYYVVGDNRSTPMHEHVFGRVHEKRIIGRPLW